MNKNAKAWVEALESGEYNQGRWTLCRSTPRGDEFCCLGVACELYFQAHSGEGWEFAHDYTPSTSYCPSTSYWRAYDSVASLPPQVKDWMGLSTSHGNFRDRRRKYQDLVSLNDSGMVSFKQVAKLIRAEPFGLFEIK